MEIPGLASKAIGFGETPVNRKKFQGQEFTGDLDLDYDEFKYRKYDPQIARFVQVDPLADKYAYNSNYDFSEDKVTSNVELEGLEGIPVNNPYLSPLFKPSVQKALGTAAKNFSESGSIKVSVGPQAGGEVNLGPVNLKVGVSGPTLTTTLAPGSVSVNGTAASAQVKVPLPNGGEANASMAVVDVTNKDGSTTANPFTYGGGIKIASTAKSDQKNDNTSATSTVDNKSQISVGAQIGAVGIKVAIAPINLAKGIINTFVGVVNYVKEAAKEQVSSFTNPGDNSKSNQ